MQEPDLTDTMSVLEEEQFNGLDRGEKICIALIKNACDEETKYVLLVTDDYDAGVLATEFLKKYQCGFVLRSADIIIFFGLRFKLSKTDIHQALRDLISYYTNTFKAVSLKLENLTRKKDFGWQEIARLVGDGKFAEAMMAVHRLHVPRTQRATRDAVVKMLNELIEKEGIVQYYDVSSKGCCLVQSGRLTFG